MVVNRPNTSAGVTVMDDMVMIEVDENADAMDTFEVTIETPRDTLQYLKSYKNTVVELTRMMINATLHSGTPEGILKPWSSHLRPGFVASVSGSIKLFS